MKLLPIGINNFKEIIDMNAYYVDKSDFISNVLKEKVVLYTRPRRFGKTLNMSMLKYFFSIKEKENAYLFNNLNISNNIEVMKHQNQYPLISISFKDLCKPTFESNFDIYRTLISEVYKEFEEVKVDLNSYELNLFNSLCETNSSENELRNALLYLTSFLEKHYHKKVILLIDEYDIPFKNAYIHGFSNKMMNFLFNGLDLVLNTNDSLYLGIMSGCIRIVNDGIYESLNNVCIDSIFDDMNSKYFGFTQNEINQILENYELIRKKEIIKKWYGGYLFGNQEMYNPYSIIHFINQMIENVNDNPKSYLNDSSSIDYLIKNSSNSVINTIDNLAQGYRIPRFINREFSYKDINNDHLFSCLLFEGYLKMDECTSSNFFGLSIPNHEVNEIYKMSYKKYFDELIEENKYGFIRYLKDGNVDGLCVLLNNILSNSIFSYERVEDLYYEMMVNLFSDYHVYSNKESDGKFSICTTLDEFDETIIRIECKYTSDLKDLMKNAYESTNEIIDKKYLEDSKFKLYQNKIGYGISFYKDLCYIKKVDL